MPEGLEHTVPSAPTSLSVRESVEEQVTKFGRWLEGYTDADGTPHPGLIVMVTELYTEAKLKRERREVFARAIASGGVLAVIGIVGAWLKEHLK